MWKQREAPSLPATIVNIRAVPTEVEESEIVEKINKYECGSIREIKTIYHKGTSIQNVYRQIILENYIPGKLPPPLLARAPCKIYLPAEDQQIECYKCRQYGHLAGRCPNETVCLKCKKTGHIRKDCPEGRPQDNVFQENKSCTISCTIKIDQNQNTQCETMGPDTADAELAEEHEKRNSHSGEEKKHSSEEKKQTYLRGTLRPDRREPHERARRRTTNTLTRENSFRSQWTESRDSIERRRNVPHKTEGK